MDYYLAIPAFIAGVLTFLAPCTLPLVPGYLGFISGAWLEDFKNADKAGAMRKKVFLNGLAFMAGWSMVFIVFGALAGFLGAALVPYRLWIGRVGGVFVILFGLFMLNALKIPSLARERHLKIPSFFERGKPINSFILGSSFGIGWTPCVGPILGSILLLASTSTTALEGGFLLAVFSAGLAVPFIAIALGVGSAMKFIARIAPFLHVVSIVGGLFLIGLGILLITNNMGLLISYGYQLFRFVEYDRLLDYL
jgi:cytochrome c-type biogenesis protein